MIDNKSAIVALIPARSGSKRLSDKNIRDLAGHPLLADTVAAAFTIHSVGFETARRVRRAFA